VKIDLLTVSEGMAKRLLNVMRFDSHCVSGC